MNFELLPTVFGYLKKTSTWKTNFDFSQRSMHDSFSFYLESIDDFCTSNYTNDEMNNCINRKVNVPIEIVEESRLAKESAKLDPALKQSMADEGLLENFKSWPE